MLRPRSTAPFRPTLWVLPGLWVLPSLWVRALWALAASGTVACGGTPVAPTAIADWAIQQGAVEERVATTCARLRSGSPARYSQETRREHQLRAGALAEQLAKAPSSPATVQQACAGVSACLESLPMPDSATAVFENDCLDKCAKPVSDIINETQQLVLQGKALPKDRNGLTGMIAAVGSDSSALAKAAAEFGFARSTIYGVVQAADAADLLVDQVADGFGNFKPLAGPVLRRVAAELMALGIDQVVEHVEKRYRQGGVSLAEQACDVTSDLAIRSATARTVLQRVILRFDDQNFDTTVGLSHACGAIAEQRSPLSRWLAGDDDLAVCESALQAVVGDDADGVSFVPTRTPAKPSETQTPWAVSKESIAALQSTPPTPKEPTAESLNALGLVADACLRENGFGSAECHPNRLSVIVSYYQTYIASVAEGGRLPSDAEHSIASLSEDIARLESNLLGLSQRIEEFETSRKHDSRFTRSALEAGFGELLKCRNAREHRDIIAAVLGYRPLRPCTRNENEPLSSSSPLLGPLTEAELCRADQVSFPLLVEFGSGQFELSAQQRSELQALRVTLETLGASLNPVEASGIATEQQVRQELCSRMKAKLNPTTSPFDTTTWDCDGWNWRNLNNQGLNSALGYLRADAVCEVLGHAACEPHGEMLNKTEVRLKFKSGTLALPGECLAGE